MMSPFRGAFAAARRGGPPSPPRTLALTPARGCRAVHRAFNFSLLLLLYSPSVGRLLLLRPLLVVLYPSLLLVVPSSWFAIVDFLL